MKVLVVDDVLALRQFAGHIVKEVVGDDAEVIDASTGDEAIRLHKSMRPELTILDISMPDVSGIQAAEKIWQNDRQAKIVFWSQFHQESYVRAIYKLLPDEAVHGYVIKGNDDKNLAYAIESLLQHDNSFIDPLVRGVQTRMKSKDGALTDMEYETLPDIAVGLTDRGISMRRHISVRAAQKRISSVLEKLIKHQDEHAKESCGFEIINPRVRCLTMAYERGLLTSDTVREANLQFQRWLAKEFDFDLANLI
jgi:DNA-binding NarL/FixJ family response regulator